MIERRDARAHAFVADLAAPELASDDRHHLERVLRLRPGGPMTVSDGQGAWRACVFGPTIEPTGEIFVDPRPSPRVAIGFALVKGGRPEWAVQKLTELGVDCIVPFAAERSVVRWDDERAARHHQRLVVVAREAAMQSRRTWLPVVEPVTSFDGVATRPGAVLADLDGEPPDPARHALVLIGPEGGWSAHERSAGLPTVALAHTMLRTDTAAVAAGVLFIAFRAGLATVREISR